MLKMKLLCVFMLATFLKQSAGADCYTGNAYTKCDDCDSDCFTSNVCICSDNSTCLPSTCDLDPSNCCPVEFSWDSSKACCTVEKTCNRICAADEECIFQDDNKICECNKSMYTNKTKQDLKPVVICDSDIISASVSRCLVQSLGYDYNSFYLNNASSGCVYHYNNITNNQRLDTYQLDAKQGWCGNIVTNDSSKIYVTNTVHFNTTPSLLITKNPIAFNITCGYNKTLQTSLQFALKPLIRYV
ncbi:Hypothetical predicted protein [Pelobates cultripes]|uniref:ZP domain-containing protein n=1 Tax=Pelobates cultripes TaxID=61616 RepID=A0AAD1R1C3_PELCU|nr:Hypothetical predicted protein [Pelobates cultripes]